MPTVQTLPVWCPNYGVHFTLNSFSGKIKVAVRWIRDHPDETDKWIKLLKDLFRKAEKTIRERAQIQIENKIKKSLNKSIKRVFIQIMILCSAVIAVHWSGHHIIAELFASITVICILLYNIYTIVVKTVPDLINSIDILRGGRGQTKLYIARMALAYFFIDGPLIMLVVLLLALGTRIILGDGFELIEPWIRLFRDWPIEFPSLP